MVRDNDTSGMVNRRKIMKLIGGASGATMVNGLTTGSVGAQSENTDSIPDTDINVVDATFETSGPMQTTSNNTEIRPKIQDLINFIEDDSRLASALTAKGTLTIQTDDEEFNSYEPSVDIIPFGNDTRESATNDQGTQSGNGLLFVYTVIEDDERIPVGTFGLTSRPLGGGQGSAEKENHQITSYILDDEEPTRAERTVVSEVSDNGNAVSIQNSAVCYSCQALVSTVCVGGSRVLGQYGCVAACSAAFGANFIAIFGCASICSTMFTAISTVSCTAGGDVICTKMTDISPWYISFC